MKYATKTNNKTVLLAVLAVFAMIAAGAAIVMASEDAEATAVTFTDIPEGGVIVTTGNYFIEEDTVLTGDKAIKIAVYLANDDTQLVVDSTTMTVDVYYADSNVKADVTTDSVKIATAIVDDDELIVTVGEFVANEIAIEGLAGVITVYQTEGYDINQAAIAYEGAYFHQEATDTYYATPLSTYGLNDMENDILTVKSGSTLVYYGTANVTLGAYDDEEFLSEEGVMFTCSEANVLDVCGTVDAGELFVSKGFMQVTAESELSYDVLDAVITGVTTDAVDIVEGYITIGEGQEFTIAPTIVGETEYGVIMGDYVFPDKNPKVAQELVINSGALLTIPAKSTFTYGNKNTDATAIIIMEGAGIDVWGTVKGVTGADGINPFIIGEGEFSIIKIRAGAEITGFVNYDNFDKIPHTSVDDAAVIEAPAIDDKDIYGISGSLTANTTVTNAEVPEEKMLTIPEGITLTVTEMLVINAEDGMVINGTLVLADGAILADNVGMEGSGIVLGAKGSIVNNGTIGRYNPVVISNSGNNSIVAMSGIQGLSYGIASNKVAVSGTLTPLSSANLSAVVFSNVIINKDMTIGEGVFAAITSDSTLKESTMTVDGVLVIAGEETELKLTAGSTLTVNGYIAGYDAEELGCIVADVTPIEGTEVEDPVWGVAVIDVHRGTAVKADNPDTYHNLTGYTIEVIAVPYVEDDVAMISQSVFISGALALDASVGTGYSLVDGEGAEPAVMCVDSDFPAYIGYGDELVQNTVGAMIEVDGAPMIVAGKLISINEIEEETGFIGALYSVKESDTVTKYFVTNYNDGLSGIAGYKDKTVTLIGLPGYEAILVDNLNILDGETVELSGQDEFMTIPEGVVLYVSNGGVFDAAIIGTLDGKIIVEADGDCEPAAYLYQVYSEDEDECITYSGFVTALAEAEVGDTITLTGVYEAENLTIPAGINVVVGNTGVLAISKTLTVSAGATLSVEGTIVVGDEDVKNTKVYNYGTFDVSGAAAATFNTYVGEEADKYALQIISDGEFIYRTTQDFPENTKTVGVTYTEGTITVLTSIDNAIEAGAAEIVIDGEYTSTEAIVLDGSKLTVNGKATFSAIDVTDGELAVAGTLNATVTGISGDDDAVVITLTGFKGTIADKEADDEYVMDLQAMTAGSIEIVSGEVTVTGDVTVADNKYVIVDKLAELTFAANSAVAVAAEGLLDIDGIMSVDENVEVEIDGAVLIDGVVIVVGDLTIGESIVTGVINVVGTFAAGDMILTGSIAVDDSTDSVAVATLSNVVMGVPTLGDAPQIIGKAIALNEGCYLAVFPGATVGTATVSGLKSTEFYTNGVLYVTAYANQGEVNAVAENGVIDAEIPMEGYDMTGSDVAANWCDVTGAAIADNTKVGAKAALFFEGVQYTAKVVVSTTTGTSIFVDGVKYASGTTINDVAVGTHTVKVSIDPGYKGTTEVTFNGKALSGLMVFEITPEMVGPTAKYVLSVTGDISIDQGEIPEQEKEDNTIIIVLLAVLVIMVVILAIVVILRMMRS